MPPVDRYESTFIVSLDPSQGDFTSLQEAINALPTTGGKVFVKAGTYPLGNTVKIKQNNVQVQGEGMGITVFVARSSMISNTPALEAFSTASDGTPRTLLADTKRGDLTIQLSPTDAASFATGDFVLLFSNRVVDTESSAPHLKCAGEVKQIAAADSTTGFVTMDD